ncbi:MAG TPA: TIGR03986 family CRISPR-associated RAMP protein, partial [Planctomycetaceae bacterium]|nr:TIGR03986 family CRISPR-associated RAMP protein [Planctomycetaceae bacterium]
MTTQTPLLVPDAALATEYDQDDPGQGINEGHKSFPVRLGPDGRPYLAPTSVKGMLRAAYEAVTNSRMSIFAGHDRELAYRMPTQEGLALVPARVQSGHLILLMGTSSFSPRRPAGPLYAAWLPRYSGGSVTGSAVSYPSGALPQHRDEVECWIELFQHHRWDKRTSQHVPDFQFWQVRKIVPRGDPLGPRPAPTHDPGPRNGRSYHQPSGSLMRISGYVCITNANIDRKHDERVFFTTDPSPPSIALDETHGRAWETLIPNYQEEHRDEIARGRAGPPALRCSVWSRHVPPNPAEACLEDHTLLYAAVRRTAAGWQILGLYPVNISRKLHCVPPQDLLPEDLRPASRIDELSPADRVFGWVNQTGRGAYRGNLRIGPVRCQTQLDRAIQSFGQPGLPVAILGQPKPQQARFYVAASQ